ncbi:MAG: cofactor-independent phosphoglycerate mutase, partial [Candidatus Omnitrophica bacterium]|nr:cofactor-independent phosphoglycerate mutase [Candidatus Omnitrophota bacterium]
QTPHMDALARTGLCAMVKTIPDGFPPGSDIGNLSLLGYDPSQNFSGRAPLEAANMGVILANDEVAFRCNLVTLQDGRMRDYSAGHISSGEAEHIISVLNKNLSGPRIKFYPGKSYRHLLVSKVDDVPGVLKIQTRPPHDILDAAVQDHLPQGAGSEILLDLMKRANQLLKDHPVNVDRIKRGELPVTDIWFWGQGSKPQFQAFKEKFGLSGSMISAVDLVNGIGRLTGLDVITVPGATGYYDTDYAAKARYGLESLEQKDFVYIHVESPDEAGHNGDYKEKVRAIEAIDKDIVAAIIEWGKTHPDYRLLIAPDHPTPVKKRTHTRAPVCFVMSGKGIDTNGISSYQEQSAEAGGLKFTSGADMVSFFLKS